MNLNKAASHTFIACFGMNLRAIYANRPIIAPEVMPIIGPTNAIITRGELGRGMEAIIPASLGWFAM